MTGRCPRYRSCYCQGVRRSGARVFLNDISDAQSVVDEIVAHDGQAEFVQGDVTKLSEMEHLVRRAVEITGRLDHFVANAVFSLRGQF